MAPQQDTSPQPRFYRYTEEEVEHAEIDLDGTLDPAPERVLRQGDQEIDTPSRRRRRRARATASKLAREVSEQVLELLLTSWLVRVGFVVALFVTAATGYHARETHAAVTEASDALGAEVVPLVRAVDASLAQDETPSLVDELIAAGAAEAPLRSYVAAYHSARTVPEKVEAAQELIELVNEQGAAMALPADPGAARKMRSLRKRIGALRDQKQSFDEALSEWQTTVSGVDANAQLDETLASSWPEFTPSEIPAGTPDGLGVKVRADLRSPARR